MLCDGIDGMHCGEPLRVLRAAWINESPYYAMDCGVF
jgi:hypothetical protein